MKPGVYNLDLYRGDSYTWRFMLWQDAPGGTPVDLTDVMVAAEIRDKPAGNVVMSMDCEITLPNIIDVRLAAALWTSGPAKAGEWDLELTYPSTEVQTVIAGKVKITGDVTHSTGLV